jgi:hypothetical protein
MLLCGLTRDATIQVVAAGHYRQPTGSDVAAVEMGQRISENIFG